LEVRVAIDGQIYIDESEHGLIPLSDLSPDGWLANNRRHSDDRFGWTTPQAEYRAALWQEELQDFRSFASEWFKQVESVV